MFTLAYHVNNVTHQCNKFSQTLLDDSATDVT